MDQQIILITGATTGIGRDTAIHLARQGHRVIATGRNVAALADLKRDAAGTPLETLRLDVTNKASIEKAARAVDMMTGSYGVDVLVNNAGYGAVSPVVESSDEEVRGQYETNVFGLLAVTRAFVPQMMDRRSGRVINVGSIGGRITLPLFGAYNSTKYAVESLSDALRRELHAFGIKVSIIEPGPIKTEFSNRSVADAHQYRGSTSRYAKVFAKAEEMKQQADRMSTGPESVVRAIEKAATARNPAARYVAPFQSRIMLAFVSLIPTVILDWVMRRALGLNAAQVGLEKPTRPSVRPAALSPAPHLEAAA